MFSKRVAAALLLFPVASEVTTCGDLKTFYKSEGCCGMPSKPLSHVPGCDAEITEAQVMAAQLAWGNGIVAISTAHANNQDYVKVATEHIETLYGYGMSHVLFKPTLASQKQFRSDFDGALSYFVASNGAAPEDGGFAIKGWTAVRFENVNIIRSGSTAMAMGNYFFTKKDGSVAKVEYSFGYFLDSSGTLRINLHHSSLPYVIGVTEAQVLAAQKAWGDGIVAISSAHTNGGDYVKVATEHIETLYGYGLGHVLFKPTLAAAQQFRSDFDGALSYFVASNGAAPEDGGFAIKGWTAVRFENVDIILAGTTATTMGNYYFTKADGSVTKVEYSFGYFLDANNHLRINLHHSSLPYSA